jgi:hypothetical protein
MAASSVIVDDSYVAEAIARNAIVWDVRPSDAYPARLDLRATIVV